MKTQFKPKTAVIYEASAPLELQSSHGTGAKIYQENLGVKFLSKVVHFRAANNTVPRQGEEAFIF